MPPPQFPPLSQNYRRTDGQTRASLNASVGEYRVNGILKLWSLLSKMTLDNVILCTNGNF